MTTPRLAFASLCSTVWSKRRYVSVVGMVALAVAGVAAILAAVLFAAAAFAGPPRDVAFDVRDVEAEDVQSVTLARVPSGWVETWTFTAYTSTDEPVDQVTFQHLVTGPPDLGQVTGLLTARLAKLNARLDEKYPETGPPGTFANPSNGGGRKP